MAHNRAKRRVGTKVFNGWQVRRNHLLCEVLRQDPTLTLTAAKRIVKERMRKEEEGKRQTLRVHVPDGVRAGRTVAATPNAGDGKTPSEYVLPSGKHRGKRLGELDDAQLAGVAAGYNGVNANKYRAVIAAIRAEQALRERIDETRMNQTTTEYVLDFGKCKGTPISNVSDDYLMWGVENLRQPKRAVAEFRVEAERRGLVDVEQDSLSREYRAIVGEPAVNVARRNHEESERPYRERMAKIQAASDATIQAPWE